MIDFAKDIEEIADKMNIEHYGIIGYSAGGPFALASLYHSHKRIFGSAIISSIAPRKSLEKKSDKRSTQRESTPESGKEEIKDERELEDHTTPSHFPKEMPALFKFAWWCSSNSQWILRMGIQANYDDYAKDPAKTAKHEWSYCKEDSKFYEENIEVQKLFLTSALENVARKQHDNEFYEWTLFAGHWGFELKDIQSKNITIYHGRNDRGCTIHMGKYLYNNIPNSRKKFVEAKGHLLIFEIWNEILQNLKDDYQSFKGRAKEINNNNKEEKKEEITKETLVEVKEELKGEDMELPE